MAPGSSTFWSHRILAYKGQTVVTKRLRENRLLQTLGSGGLALGYSLNGARDPGAIYVAAGAGADVVFIDLEHNLTSAETVFDLVSHAHGAGISALVRPPQIDYAWITRLLDGGCQSLLVPHARHRAEVEQLIEYACYQPTGQRGVALVGGANMGYQGSAAPVDVMRSANQNLLLGLVIETPEAVEHLDDLLLPEIGLLVVGRGDLAHSYGYPGATNHDVVVDALAHVRAACARRGIAYGVFEPHLKRVPDEIRGGAQLVVHGGVFSYIRNSITELRDAASSASSDERT